MATAIRRVQGRVTIGAGLPSLPPTLAPADLLAMRFSCVWQWGKGFLMSWMGGENAQDKTGISPGQGSAGMEKGSCQGQGGGKR